MYPIIRLGDHFYLPSYFTVIAMAYCVALFYLHYRARHFQSRSKVAMDLALIIMITGLIGSRLFHVFYELPLYYLEHPLDIFKIWQGGFVFYGGALTSAAAAVWYLKRERESLLHWLDVFAPIVPVTYFLGRFATLLSGSGYGKPTDLPWAIVYPVGTEAPAGIPLHPTPLYAMTWEALVFIVLWGLEKKANFKKVCKAGSLFYVMMIGHGLGRLVIEQFRDDLRGASFLGFTISSWISLVVLTTGLALLLHRLAKTKNAHPMPN